MVGAYKENDSRGAAAFRDSSGNDKGIGISTQGISVVPVDQNGNVLRNAFSWLDRRAQEEAEKIEADFGAEGIFDLAGKPAAAAYTLPKLMWMKKHERKLYDSTYRFYFRTITW